MGRVVLLFLVFGCSVGYAQDNRLAVSFGNDYAFNCKEFIEGNQPKAGDIADAMQFTWCAGYTNGLWEMLLSEPAGNVCSPSAEVSNLQVARVINKWIM